MPKNLEYGPIITCQNINKQFFLLLRYESLYVISGEETKHNKLGGAYTRFRMDRVMNQPAMNMKRPTKEEVKLCR